MNFCTFFLDLKYVFLILRNNLSDVGQTKSVKIIKDKDEKPKGFGYIEFEELEGLKDALSKTGSVFPYFFYTRIENNLLLFPQEFFWAHHSCQCG